MKRFWTPAQEAVMARVMTLAEGDPIFDWIQGRVTSAEKTFKPEDIPADFNPFQAVVAGGILLGLVRAMQVACEKDKLPLEQYAALVNAVFGTEVKDEETAG